MDGDGDGDDEERNTKEQPPHLNTYMPAFRINHDHVVSQDQQSHTNARHSGAQSTRANATSATVSQV